MDIKGLDYNTQREHLVLREYGRTLQNLVDKAVETADKKERQRQANAIIKVMEKMYPPQNGQQNHRNRLWEQLAIMSNFRLDIDYPCDISSAQKISEKPSPMPYSMTTIPVRHYGKMVFEMFEKLKVMPDGAEYDELVRLTANQMKRDLAQWGHGSVDDGRIISDLERFTDGRVQANPALLTSEKKEQKTQEKRRKKK